MAKQIIVTIGREYGSAGHEIAKQLADRLGLPFYDQNIVDELANAEKLDSIDARMYDDVPKNFFTRSDLTGKYETQEEKMSRTEFEIIKKHAEAGESFVIVGRCAEYVLREYPFLVTIFVLGDIKQRQKRIMNLYQMTAEEARAAISFHDKQRQTYHNGYSTTKWGEAKGYDLCVNSSKLGVKNTVAMLESYVRMRWEND